MRWVGLLLAGVVLVLARPASADHGVVRCGNTGLQACLATSSPFVNQYIKPAKELTYCVNPRGLQYPGFRSQTVELMSRWAADLKLAGAREVPYPTNIADLSCLIRNDMRDDHPCGGCGAWVYTHNLPVLIEYNARTGYTRWDSTIGHEVGHAFCLLDEHYDKVNFRSFILTFGFWQHGAPTAMDSGTPFIAAYAPLGIRFATEYDLDRCEETLLRSLQEPECQAVGFDPCGQVFRFPDGWAYSPFTGVWFNPHGWPEWEPCNIFGERFNHHHQDVFLPGSSFYSDERGFWSTAGAC